MNIRDAVSMAGNPVVFVATITYPTLEVDEIRLRSPNDLNSFYQSINSSGLVKNNGEWCRVGEIRMGVLTNGGMSVTLVPGVSITRPTMNEALGKACEEG